MLKKKTFFIIVTLIAFALKSELSFGQKQISNDDRFITFIVDPQKQHLQFYWKNDSLVIFRSILNLKNWLDSHHEQLIFAMNGGMYKTDNSPLGLFIENGKTKAKLNTAEADGNFYLKPNGVFYITSNNIPVICKTEHFLASKNIRYATQSGPMLVIDGQLHPAFKQGSVNTNIRNGVGILPGNQIVFVMSKTAINFYDFAAYFKSIGCNNALYLDGFVSRTYLPQKNWMQTDGNFGVIIAVTEKVKK